MPASSVGPSARLGDPIPTFSGLLFYPLDPRVEDIRAIDIATALSHTCRWVGQLEQHYSVAQHAVLVSLACDPADALWGLLHDAHEAYVNDLTRAVKWLPGLEPYRAVCDTVQRVICDRYGLAHEQPRSVTQADDDLCATEARDLVRVPGWLPKSGHLLPQRITPIPAAEACARFMDRFVTLTKGRL